MHSSCHLYSVAATSNFPQFSAILAFWDGVLRYWELGVVPFGPIWSYLGLFGPFVLQVLQ